MEANSIAAAIAQFFKFWTSRQENYDKIYNTKKQKKRDKALNTAEKAYLVIDRMIVFADAYLDLSKKEIKKEWTHYKEEYSKLKEKFNKYD